MSTSANVIEYSIYKINNTENPSKSVGSFRINVMCKYPDFAELLKYQPLNEHIIEPWGYDEEEEEWNDEPENLEDFLKGMKSNKWLRAYFAGEKTAEQILQELKDIQDEIRVKMIESFNRQSEVRKKELNEKK